MSMKMIPQCDRSLDFAPRSVWPRAFPAMCWRGQLLTAFERQDGVALELCVDGVSLAEAILACYPELGFSEMARLQEKLSDETSSALFSEYGLRWCDRLRASFQALRRAPREFQDFVDDKKMSVRDLSPLVAVPSIENLHAFLRALGLSTLSKSQAALLLENGVELFLIGQESILRLENESDADYCLRLEKARKPMTAARDESWRKEVSAWAWPAQVQGQWQRFGDQAGLEIKLRATSPQDLVKKLERLNTIGKKWSCST